MQVDKINKIFHISDIHIRKFNRHQEYKIIFKKIYKYLKSNFDDTSVICVTGDIVHSKTDMSPELVSMVSLFFKMLADIGPTIVIPGNHDTNLNNDSRLDPLTPILEILNNPNILYWKDVGVYKLGNVSFSVFSIFSESDKWVPASDIDSEYKVALYHGPIASAVTELDWEIENDNLTIGIFNGFDLALLGDIHKFQYLNKEKTIGYPGSIIQQNHGESLIHGFLKWDLPSKTSEFIPILNDIAYATIEVINGKIITDREYINALPKKLRLRIKYKNTSHERLHEIIKILKQNFKFIELTYMRMGDVDFEKSSSDIILGDVQDVEYQNSLIAEYLTTNSDQLINLDEVRELNRKMNKKLPSIFNTEIIRNVMWKPLEFKFSNMFSYGEDNSIDFSNLSGINGLFAGNAFGKSAAIDSLTFTLFDKCSRTYKAKDVLNNNKKSFVGELKFELDDQIYVIKRSGKRKTGKQQDDVPVTVDFGKYVDGKYISLNGEDRFQTNKNIRSYIGSYEDFVLTSLSTQTDNKNFISMSQKERRDLLNSFLDITIFDNLYTITKDEIKEKLALIKIYEVEVEDKKYVGMLETILQNKQQLNDYSSSYLQTENEIKTHNKTIRKISDKIQYIEDPVDIDIIEKKMVDIIKSKDEQKKEQIKLKSQLEVIENDLNNCIGLFNEFDLKEIENAEKEEKSLIKKIQDKTNEVYKLEVAIKHLNETISHLENHEYDPNCEYCVKNPFVQNAYEAKDNLPVQMQLLMGDKKLLNELEEQLRDFQTITKQRKEYSKLKNEITDKTSKKELITVKMDNLIQSLIRADETILDLEEKKKKYTKQKNIIQKNKEHELSLKDIQKKYDNAMIELKEIHSKILEYTSSLISLENSYSEYDKKKNLLKILYQEISVYETYLQAISKHGVPYLLLKKIIPVIESEVNHILNQLVDFYITLEMDDKNISCYIHYNDDKYWPVELSSGMERFMISIATRVALVDVSSLPRPNFLAIDEGFGALDSEKLIAMEALFTYLKTQFDFILCISHLDTMKDLADNLITIEKTSAGYSKIEI